MERAADSDSFAVLLAETFPVNYRPWVWFESLVIEHCFQVRLISVKPSDTLRLQIHRYMSEHWIVVEGTAKITSDSKIINLSAR